MRNGLNKGMQLAVAEFQGATGGTQLQEIVK